MTSTPPAHTARFFLQWFLAALGMAAFQGLATPLLAKLLCRVLPRFAPDISLPWALADFHHFFPRILWGAFALAAFFFAVRRHPSRPCRFRVVLEAASLALLSIVLFSSLLGWPVAFYDEGLILAGAWRVSAGALPYRDFFTIYAPGQTVLLGALFALFGKSILLARFVDLAFRVAASLMVWLLLRPFVRPLPRLLCHVSFVLWLVTFGAELSPLAPFLFFVFLALVLLCSPPSGTHSVFPCTFSGLAMGAALLFRHDLALTTVAAIALLLCVPSAQPARLRPAWRAPLAFVLATIPIPLLAFGSLALAVPVHDLWEQLVSMPVFVFPAYRSLPYPSLRAWASSPLALSPCFLAPALLAAVSVAVFVRAVRKRAVSSRARRVLFLAAFATAIFPYALGRSDVGHILFCALPVLPMAFLAIPPLRRWGLPSILLAAWTLSFGFTAAPSFRSMLQIRLAQRQTLAELRAALDRQPPGPIFVGESTHDRLVLNDVALYFLLDRPPATKYFAFEPGVVTSPAVQDEMIRELLAARVQTVILRTDAPDIEPNRSAEDSRARRLDSFLRHNFVPVAHVPPYLIYSRQHPPSQFSAIPPSR